ncbi:hypothetical protein DNTS_021072 [Danionella cerebrum]|uniref:Paired box protein Pax-4 n=1 Tax=Danionella cerebrum TaxID=2873325 RepID=A0A553Q283_9TELE|nr:hypothetical protein DNTS_021072 [Danionella translucida]
MKNGRPLPVYKRKLMIELACEGMKSCQISRVLKVSNGCVSKILTRFHRTGVITPKAIGGSRPRILTSELISIIAELKRQNPTLFAWEIRKKLETQRACSGEHIPSVSSINRILKKSRLEVDSVILPEQCSYSEWGSSQTPDKTFQQQTDTDMREPSHRSRTAFTPDQSQSLEKEFSSGVYPDQQTREKLSEDTKLPQNTIKVWFSNRRAKMRREQQAECANREFQGNPPHAYHHFPMSPVNPQSPVGEVSNGIQQRHH